MADTRSEATPLGDRFSLDEVIGGLIEDLKELRAGKISTEDARVRAELSKQIMNGVRMVISAQKFLAQNARLVPPTPAA